MTFQEKDIVRYKGIGGGQRLFYIDSIKNNLAMLCDLKGKQFGRIPLAKLRKVNILLLHRRLDILMNEKYIIEELIKHHLNRSKE